MMKTLFFVFFVLKIVCKYLFFVKVSIFLSDYLKASYRTENHLNIFLNNDLLYVCMFKHTRKTQKVVAKQTK